MDFDIAYKELRLLKIDLKKSIVNEINKIGLNRQKLSEKLYILPSGVEILFDHDYWSIEKAMAIIKILDLKTKLVIRNE